MSEAYRRPNRTATGNKTVDYWVIKPDIRIMTLVEKLLKVTAGYKSAAGISKDSRLSRQVFDDGKKIAALRGGGDLTTRRYEAALAWFDANWPQGVEKPDELSECANSTNKEVGRAA
ncbi:hypothetical protein [uncultured Roseobacter sp.]|uniref:hypothetical protein n=1 Tax=uncultured Roseobacter sp. TaxID=114847 RepID=UPI002633721A|nr:hypothetical protein [uncultured Roseobacter sp.]